MRVFKSRDFAKFARKAGITDQALLEAVAQIERGIVDVDLGGGVYKQRIARPGAGKSGGFRTILLMKAGELLLFVDGFAKSEKSNLSREELLAFREIARGLLWDEQKLLTAIKHGVLQEIQR